MTEGKGEIKRLIIMTRYAININENGNKVFQQTTDE